MDVFFRANLRLIDRNVTMQESTEAPQAGVEISVN